MLTMSWVHLLLYQASWWACALSGPYELPLLGPFAVFTQLLVWLRSVQLPVQEGVFILCMSFVGIAIDSTLLNLGVLIIPAYFFVQPPFPPLWLVSLWVSFAVGLRSSLQKLRKKYLLAALLGCVGGPLAYRGGMALDALVLSDRAVWILALIWAVLFPLLLNISERSLVQLRFQQSS